MLLEVNENVLRYLLDEDSVAVREEIDQEAEEIAELMPDEYCDPIAEFKL